MCWVQTISRKGQQHGSGARSARFVEGHDFSRAVKGGKISRALAPEVLFSSAGILRDCMPDSNSHWKRYSPNCMATCREWQKCPLHFPIINDVGKSVPQRLKPKSRARPTARL